MNENKNIFLGKRYETARHCQEAMLIILLRCRIGIRDIRNGDIIVISVIFLNKNSANIKK